MPRPPMSTYKERAVALWLCCALAQLVMCHAALAAQYHVHVPATIDWPGWWSPVKGGPFTAGNLRVDSQIGQFASGEYRRWRLLSPGTTRILGGKLTVRSRTSTPGMIAQVRTGSDGGASRVLWQSSNDGEMRVPIIGGNDWIEFGLATTAPARTSHASSDAIVATDINVIMGDDAPPLMRFTTTPDAVEWYGLARCAPWSMTASDTGSGLRRFDLQATDTPTIIDGWNTSAKAGLAPGDERITRTGCISSAHAIHGRNTFPVTATDFAGLDRVSEITARFDLVPPIVTLTHETPDHSFDTPHPSWAATAVDTDSGIQDVTARIDDMNAVVDVTGSTIAITASQHLSEGSYVLRVVVRDNAGNVTSLERPFTIVDETPPTITVTAPTDHGSSTPWIAAAASDAGSGIVPASWRVLIDGQPCDAASADSSLAGPLGTLTSGTHSIFISIRDAAGNIGFVTRTYIVDAPAETETSAIPDGRSGIFPQGTLPRVFAQGSDMSIPVIVAHHGRPLTGYHVQLRHSGRLLDDAISDAAGLVTLHALADRPMIVRASVAGVDVPARSFSIRVAPRITLRASNRTTTVGQRVAVHGRIQPATSARRVRLYARVEGSWYPLQRAVSVSHRGRFRGVVQSSVPGRIAVQARVPARRGWSASASNVIWINVQ